MVNTFHSGSSYAGGGVTEVFDKAYYSPDLLVYFNPNHVKRCSKLNYYLRTPFTLPTLQCRCNLLSHLSVRGYGEGAADFEQVSFSFSKFSKKFWKLSTVFGVTDFLKHEHLPTTSYSLSSNQLIHFCSFNFYEYVLKLHSFKAK